MSKYMTVAEMHRYLWDLGLRVSFTRTYQLLKEWKVPHVRIGESKKAGRRKKAGRIFVEKEGLTRRLQELGISDFMPAFSETPDAPAKPTVPATPDGKPKRTGK